jgi:hypothetical protein
MTQVLDEKRVDRQGAYPIRSSLGHIHLRIRPGVIRGEGQRAAPRGWRLAILEIFGQYWGILGPF